MKAIAKLSIAVLLLVGVAMVVAASIPRTVRAAGPWYVATTGSDGNTCLSAVSPCATINGALGKITPGDKVLVATGTYTATGAGVVSLNISTTLSGGWNSGFTAQTGMSTIDGQGGWPGITVNSGVTAVLEHFVVRDSANTGIDNFGTLTLNSSTVSDNTGAYGGIYNVNGTLTLNNSTVSDNTGSYTGGISNNGAATLNNSTVSDNTTFDYFGGGIDNSGTLTLNNSTVNGNTAGGNGGGILNGGLLTLNNSTVNGNTSQHGSGGGISGGTITLNNSTISGNSAGSGSGGGIYGVGTITLNNSTISDNSASSGGGISGTMTLQNSILAGNTSAGAGPDCSGVIGSLGYNLVGNIAGCDFTSNTGDVTNTNPNLGLLIGSPAYHPLLSGSPAIDAGNPAGCKDNLGNPLTMDERGAPRIGRCDIGAYEYTLPGPAARLLALSGTPQHALPFSAFGFPLQAAVLDSIGSPVSNTVVTFFAPASGASGTFASSGTYTTAVAANASGMVTSTIFTANGLTGIYSITATVSGVITSASFLLGNIAWHVATNGNNGNDCQTPATSCATINGVLAKDGFIAGDTVLVASGTYTSSTGSEVVLLNKSATLSGGWNATFTTQSGTSTIDGGGPRRGITINSRSVTAIIERFVVQNGSPELAGGDGGGIDNYGALTLNNSIIKGNSAGNSGGSGGGGGAGIFNFGTLTLNNSTVSGNTILGGFSGSGIYNEGTLTLNNSTISGNTHASSGGGGIFNFVGTVTLNNSTVSDNTAYYGGGGIFTSFGTVTLNNSTVSSNTGQNGGGIFNDFGTVTLNNSTVSGNIGNGIDNGGTLTLNNSILAGNTSAGAGPDCNGSMGSSGYNLIGNTSGCTFTPSAGDLTNVGAKLGPLQNNGGPTPTQALLPGSPAINAGNPGGCLGSAGLLTADQRGLARFGRCDMGAYELQPLDYSTKTVSPSISAPSRSLTYTIALPNAGVSNITNILVTDTLPINLTYKSNSLIATGGTYGFDSGVITWTGSLNAGGVVTVTFGATVNQTAPLSATITNSAVINGGGEILTRSAIVDIPPAKVYLPLTARNYCTGPFYTDDFSNPASGWPVGDSGNARYEYLSGEYRILLRHTNWSVLVTPGLKASDSIVAVDVRNATGTYGSYGLLFGLSDDFSQFYDFEIDPAGNYAIYRLGSGTLTPLTQGSSGSIHTGTATNRLKLERNGSLIKVYANGQLLTSVSDGSYTGLRRVGLIAFSYDQPNVDVRFDNFKAYAVECESIATSFSTAKQMTDAASPTTGELRSSGTETPQRHVRLDTLPANNGSHLPEGESRHP